MILSQEHWMELRAFKALAEAGATWAEIARETGYDWRTVKRYLSDDAPAVPPAPAKRGLGPRLIDPYAHLAAAGVELPHDPGLLPRPVLLLHRRPGPGHVLGLPPAGVRFLRWRPRGDHVRPDQDGGAPACRPWAGHPAAPGGGRVRRALRLRDLAGCRLPAPVQGPGRAASRGRAQPCPGGPHVRLPGRDGRRVPGMATDPPGTGPSHPRRGHRGARRTRPGGAWWAA